MFRSRYSVKHRAAKRLFAALLGASDWASDRIVDLARRCGLEHSEYDGFHTPAERARWDSQHDAEQAYLRGRLDGARYGAAGITTTTSSVLRYASGETGTG